MKFILRLLLLLLLEAFPALAATSTLTGTFVDASGNPVNGYLILQLPVPAVDTATGNSIAVTPVRYRVVNGIVQSGPPVYDVAGLQPQNLYYITSLYDNSGTRIFTANYFITGTPFNLSAAIPTNITTSNISFAPGNLVNVAGNNTFTGINKFANINTRVYADQQAGSDACAKIATAWNSLPVATFSSGIIDATGFQGNQPCAASPFNGIRAGLQGELWICGATFQMANGANVVIPPYIKIKSCGQSIGKPVGGFQAATGFTGVLISFGTALSFGEAIEYMTIDCFNQPGVIGVQNKFGQQGAHFSGVVATNCPGGDFDVEGVLAQNSGPYYDNYAVNDSSCTNCSAGTVMAKFSNLVTFRGVEGLSLVNGATTPTNALLIDSAPSYYNQLEFEGVGSGITIGANIGTLAVNINSAYCHNTTTCITISNAFSATTSNINIFGIAEDTTTNLLIDQMAGNTLTVAGEGPSVGWYHLGEGSPLTVCSSSHNVTCTMTSMKLGTGASITSSGAGGTMAATVENVALRQQQVIADQGSVCTNGELALSAGWQSTGTATVTAVAGNGQTCSWTITTGTTTAANPTATDTLTNALPAATTVCELNIHGGTHTAAAGEGFQQTTLSATAPVFTFNGTPTAGGTTYFVTRRCGP